ncbi:MAG: hypothetical protein AAFR81_18835 [Chloroflexota bacterium]
MVDENLLSDHEHLWTKDVSEYVIEQLITIKNGKRHLIGEIITHPPTQTVLIIEIDSLNNEVIRRMKKAGVLIKINFIREDDTTSE